MDVERKTTIVAGMNVQPAVEGLRQIGDEAAKTASRIAQSSEQMSRALQNVPRSFDAMQKKFVDGYADALKYADAWRVVQNTLAKGGDALSNAQTILSGISKQFGLTAQEAEAAAKRMHDSSLSQEERLKAQKALMEQVIAGRKRLAEEAAFQAQDPAQLDALRAKYDPLFAAQQKLAKQTAEIMLLQEKQLLGEREVAAALEKVRVAYDAATAALGANNAARQQAVSIQAPTAAETSTAYPSLIAARRNIEQRAGEQRAAESQTAINQLLGVQTGQPFKSAAESASVFSAALDAVRARYNPLFAAQQQYARNIAEIAEHEKSGALNAQEAADARQVETERLNAQTAALDKQAQAAKQLAQDYDKLRATTSLGPGASDPFKQFEEQQKQIQDLRARGLDTAKADELQAQSKDKLRASIDPLFRASKQYETELERIIAVSKELNLTQAQTDTHIAQLNQRYAAAVSPLARNTAATNQYVGANGQLQFAMRQLGVQSVQAFSGLATGQPIMMTLIQQGHQVVDIMLATGVSFSVMAAKFRAALLAFVTNPIFLMVAAIAALGAALGVMTYKAETANRALKDLENQVRGVRDDFGAMSKEAEMAAHHLAQTTTLSFEEAFKATSLVAKQPEFIGNQAQMEDLVKTAQAMSKVFGGDAVSNMQDLAKAMTHAGDVAQDLLGKRLKNVDSIWVDMVRNMEAKNPAKAFQMVFDKIKEGTAGATDNMTELQKEWARFTQLLTGNGEGFWKTIGEGIANGLLAPLLRLLNDAIEKLETLSQKFRELVNASGQLPVLGGSGFEAPIQVNPNVAPGNIGPGAPYSAPGNNNLLGIRPAGQSTGFQSFPTPEASVAAGIKQLQIYQDRDKLNTVAQMIAKYAPSSENNTAQYIANVQAILNKQRELDKNLPQIDVNAAIDTHDQATIRRVIAAMARIESGKQIPQEIIDKGVAQAFGNAGGGVAPSGGAATATTPSGVTTTSTSAIEKALQDAKNTIPMKAAEYQRQYNTIKLGLQEAQKKLEAAPAGSEERKQYETQIAAFQQRLRELTSEITNNISEQEKMRRSLEDANRPLKEDAGAAREYAEVMEQFRQKARDANGGIIDQTALAGALAAKHAELAARLHDAVHAMDQQTAAQLRLVEAHEKGGVTLETAENVQRAFIEADKYAKAGTEEHKAIVVELTGAYERASAAKREITAADFKHQLDEENESLALQEKLLGASTAEVNRQTAALRARRAQGLAAGDTPTASQQRNIEEAKRTADVQTRVDREKAAYQELETFGESVFDKLGSAMEQSWQKGADAAKVWRDAITSVIGDVLKEFFKLAVLNPLMNDLFGSNKPTLGDLFGGNKEGGGGILGSGAGGGGIIGGLVNKVGGEGFFQGGGLIGSLFGEGSVGLAGGLGGVYHAGGVVGLDRTPLMLVPPGIFDHAPRYAGGLGSDEFAAILHRSERVLTSAQNDRTERVLSRVANSDGPRTHREGMPNVVFNISTPDADSFRASQPQIAARTVTAVNRSIMRMKT